MDLLEFGARVAIFYIPLLLSLCVHEYSHGLVAKWKGDNTADYQGRLSLNPMVHADMVGTVILPLSALWLGWPVIGWGKPVPVDERYMKNPRVDMFWVALAGPLSNILMAVLAAFLYALFTAGLPIFKFTEATSVVLAGFINMNIFLAVFNLIPVHPLDGGKVLARFLPPELNRKFEENQHIFSWALLILMLTGALGIIFKPAMGVSHILIALFQKLFI